MTFKQFVKSKWFPVLVFVILEVIFILITFNLFQAVASYCFPGYCGPGHECYSCKTRNYDINGLLMINLFGILINLAISFIVYYLIKRFYK